jgi:alanyl-tRNA synthetase
MHHLTVQQIRNSFIDYFVKQGHTHVPSSPLVPYNDPTLMFVNSGMVQFKDVFTGVEARDYSRATSAQKSVRAGGKHNDLENVGYTARHHTFFEMLGNFSFGDYFKEEAIFFAWNMLTKTLGLAKEKLYITVYHDDDEAANLWKKIAGLNDDRIIRINTNDNFWSMGDTGPCGPCSEIFYDHGEHIWGGLPGSAEQDGDRFIEIWNLVFMQYEQVDKDTRILLPKKSVDTGMGLERIAAVIQGVHDNYDIDVFKEIIAEAETLIKNPACDEALSSYRVIADHLRSSAFLIADGVMPSNEGRGYVLRRIMRRAMRHAHQLGAKEPVMYKLLPKLETLFGHTYPELSRAEAFVSSILKQEEERFKVTLERGLKLLEDEIAPLTSGDILSGEVAFKLYDTYGFPLDLTQDILKKSSLTIDLDQFENQMNMQKERARQAWVGSGESKTDAIWFDLADAHGATEFLGYSLEQAESKILSLVQNKQQVQNITEIGVQFTLIANQTPFYGESGGQMGDIGEIESSGAKIEVINTLKFLGKIIGHICVLKHGKIQAGDDIKMTINHEYRRNLKMHHTATHILHAVLRETLGKHVAQKGSLVAQDKLRFDFSHMQALTKEQITQIEEKVNYIITHNSDVVTQLMSKDHAIEAGAMALFGEKYEDEVRVVYLGQDLHKFDAAANPSPYSFELCGGTHVKRTGDIGLFKIISESAIAGGVRRIEASCGEFALKYMQKLETLLVQVNDMVKSNNSDLVAKIESLLMSKKELEKQLDKTQLDLIALNDDVIESKIINTNKGKLLYHEIKADVTPKIIRMAIENLVKQHQDIIAIFSSKLANKLSLVIAVGGTISKDHNAGDIAKYITNIIGGSGGGGGNIAQVSCNDGSKENQIKDLLISYLE